MKVFCIVPVSLQPPEHFPAALTSVPGLPTHNIMRIDFGADYTAEAKWRDTPGVRVLPEHFAWHEQVPLQIVNVLNGAWGIAAGDTVAQAARKIRTAWPHFDP